MSGGHSLFCDYVCRKGNIRDRWVLAGIDLDVIHFPTKAEPGNVAPEILKNMGLLLTTSVVLLCLIVIILFIGYPITRKTHKEALAQLEIQRASSS